jgi:hypothetical protein
MFIMRYEISWVGRWGDTSKYFKHFVLSLSGRSSQAGKERFRYSITSLDVIAD